MKLGNRHNKYKHRDCSTRPIYMQIGLLLYAFVKNGS